MNSEHEHLNKDLLEAQREILALQQKNTEKDAEIQMLAEQKQQVDCDLQNKEQLILVKDNDLSALRTDCEEQRQKYSFFNT